jgi:hypothetical protein
MPRKTTQKTIAEERKGWEFLGYLSVVEQGLRSSLGFRRRPGHSFFVPRLVVEMAIADVKLLLSQCMHA